MSRLLSLAALASGLAFAACADAPLAPEASPQFLIGGSPLSSITLVPNDNENTAELFVPLTVNRGIAEASIEDKFFVRLRAEFKVADCDACTVGPADNAIVGQKDTEVRQGSNVSIVTCVNLPSDTWNAIKGLTNVPVEAVAELVMVTGSGTEKVLDFVSVGFIIDID